MAEHKRFTVRCADTKYGPIWEVVDTEGERETATWTIAWAAYEQADYLNAQDPASR